MNPEILNLEPKSLWNNFSALNAIPRPSKKEEKVRRFMVDFGKNLNLETLEDEVGNILIKKTASPGMEDRQTVALQSHLDMVHQKNNDTNFDFSREGIKMKIEDGFVKAEGTTLGADNGIGVASIMTLLASTDIAHPAIEALFTIDEETGMSGAKGLQPNWLQAKIMLNLDTEEDDELDIGCAGGIDVTATANYNSIETSVGLDSYMLSVKGLMGGHSGIDIHKGRANANKVLVRFLFELKDEISLSHIEGGSLRNAIPREAFAIFSFSNKAISDKINTLKNEILNEFSSIEKNMEILFEKVDFQSKRLDNKSQSLLINTLMGIQNGVFRWSPDIADLVEASNNVARVETINGKMTIMCLTRSSVESTKTEVANTLKAVMQLGEFDVEFSGDYPGWKPEPNAAILHLMKKLYVNIFQTEPKIVACHAGLECGIIGSKYPGMEMISFGPNIYGAHSPDERVEINSVQKFWKYLLEILSNFPKK